MAKTIIMHSSKVFNYIYPAFAKEFLLQDDYEVFADAVKEKFDLTTDQWMALLEEWEFKERILNNA